MELMLGLALPTHNPTHGFDLNNPALLKSDQICSTDESKKLVKNKRSFDESFGHSLKTLPLLVWSGQPNEEDDRGGKMHGIHTSNKNEEEENTLVGWPPIKSWRKKKFHRQSHPAAGGQNRNNRIHANENQSRGENSLYVKVHMEGVAIGRKIDLKLYDSYHTLTNSLVNMFAKYQKFEDDEGASHTLNFQNEQGDWLLARHVPWQSFIGSVRRLVILRGENGTI